MLQILGHSLPLYIIVSLILYLYLFYRYLSSLGYVDESKLAIYGSVSIFKILEILLSDSLSPFSCSLMAGIWREMWDQVGVVCLEQLYLNLQYLTGIIMVSCR